MAQRVVDVLEVVEVDVEDGERGGAAPAGVEARREPIEEGTAVGEIGQRVLLRQRGNPLVGLQQARRVARRGPHGGDDGGAEQQAGDQHGPRARMIAVDQPRGSGDRHQRPSSVAGRERVGPMRPRGERAQRLRLNRDGAQAGLVNGDRHRVRVGGGGEQDRGPILAAMSI